MKKIDRKVIKIRQKIDNDIEHIGGKKMIINRQGTIKYFDGKTFSNMTPAEFSFIMRRPSLLNNENNIIYYGHVDGLGYFIAEDEIEN